MSFVYPLVTVIWVVLVLWLLWELHKRVSTLEQHPYCYCPTCQPGEKVFRATPGEDG